MYFIITNKKENQNKIHHDKNRTQYNEGLIEFPGEFNDDPNYLRHDNGLYVTDAANILKSLFLNYGVYLREVTFPTLGEKPNFKMIKCKSEDRWRSNMIIIGKRYDLHNIDTFKHLIEHHNAKIHDSTFTWSIANDHFDILKYLVSKRGNIYVSYYDNINFDNALYVSVLFGRLDYVKYLFEYGKISISHKNTNHMNVFFINIKEGYLDIVKFFMEHGANMYVRNDIMLRCSVESGHLSIVKYLTEKDVTNQFDYMFAASICNTKHPDIYEHLKNKCLSLKNECLKNEYLSDKCEHLKKYKDLV
jgi:hypothetical protein